MRKLPLLGALASCVGCGRREMDLFFGNTATTLAVGITYLKDEEQSFGYGTLSAVIMLTAVPLILLFLFFQRRLVRGLAEGALKGRAACRPARQRRQRPGTGGS